MDEGWTRWLFEMYGFDFVNIRDADFRARYNAVVVAGLQLGEKESAEALLQQLEERRPGDKNVEELRRRFDEAMAEAAS